jgi:hypothetical protein
MSSPAADVTPVGANPQLSPRLWIAAAAEIAVAVAVAAVMLNARDHSTMGDMAGPQPTQFHWHLVFFVATGLTAATLVWWLVTRTRIPALLTAAGLLVLSTSETVRAMALQSHLVAMAALEALLVAAPLLLIAAMRRDQPTANPEHTGLSTLFVVIAVALNSALLIALHLPSVHDRGAALTMVPQWLTLVAATVGLSYWAAILTTAGRVKPALRRGALIVGQEVAAILGLAALVGGHPHMHHTTVLGLPATLDQRLGGALMLVTCAAVTLPLAKHLEQQRLSNGA